MRKILIIMIMSFGLFSCSNDDASPITETLENGFTVDNEFYELDKAAIKQFSDNRYIIKLGSEGITFTQSQLSVNGSGQFIDFSLQLPNGLETVTQSIDYTNNNDNNNDNRVSLDFFGNKFNALVDGYEIQTGTVTITKNETNYTLELSFTLLNDKTVSVYYQGEIMEGFCVQ